MKSFRSILKSIFNLLPEEIIRLRTSYVYNKEDFKSYIDSKVDNSSGVFTDIYDMNMWHEDESASGEGSTMEATKTVRKVLPQIIEQYQIQSMLDTPCGDYNWMKTIDKKCQYIGGDIVKEIIENNQKRYGSDTVSFQHLDMTKDDLPKVDMIFCKDCLQHLSHEHVAAALNNFKRSGSKYLLVSSFPRTWRNHDIYDGDYRPLNICIKPFNLPKPIYKFREESISAGVSSDKYMYLYKLDTLPNITL